jgi:hypothetical protein
VCIVMEGEKDMFPSPSPTVHEFANGDMVHVFEGTGVGNVKMRHAAWFGRVVGREGDTYLVRNRLLVAKGRPVKVDGKFMEKQTDSGLSCGTQERVHFRTLSKRTRERILHSADEQNNWSAQAAQKELIKVKKQKTEQKDAYIARREKIESQGATFVHQCKTELEQEVQYWQGKYETIKGKFTSTHEDRGQASHKHEVLYCLVLPSLFLSGLVSFVVCLLVFLLCFLLFCCLTSHSHISLTHRKTLYGFTHKLL